MSALTVWRPDHSSGLSHGGDMAAEASRMLAAQGAVIVESGDRPYNHRIAGIGVGHDDACFAETGESYAAYLENGEVFGGRWWEEPRTLARYYAVA